MTEIQPSLTDIAITTRQGLTSLFEAVQLPDTGDPLFATDESRLTSLRVLMAPFIVAAGNSDPKITLWQLIEPHLGLIDDRKTRKKLEALQESASQPLSGNPITIEKLLGDPNKPGSALGILSDRVGEKLNAQQKAVLALALDTF